MLELNLADSEPCFVLASLFPFLGISGRCEGGFTPR